MYKLLLVTDREEVIDTFAKARAAGVAPEAIKAAQKHHDDSQTQWEWWTAENSVGFHNPTKALNTLAQSQRYSQQAVDIAIEAAAFTTARNLAGDIKKIVPPIMKHSRELQMDPVHLASHPWLKYLPLTPKAEKVWEENRRLVPAAASN